MHVEPSPTTAQVRPFPPLKCWPVVPLLFTAVVFGDGIKITLSVTLVPTKAQDKAAKRRMDAVLIHYLIENTSKQAHKVGLRAYIDTYIIDNDGALFAAPTMPNKILDGVVLKGKEL